MLVRNLAFCLAAALALTACGKPRSAGQGTGPNAPHAAAAPSAAPRNAAVHQSAEQPADLPAKITHMNEEGAETADAAQGDSGAHNPLLAAVASTVVAATATAAAATAESSWQEGVNYTRIVPAQPTSVPAGQVEVLEFFWYACPHCYTVDPLVEAWRKTKPAYVRFSRIHVLWNEGHRSLARMFFTLESMGKLDQLHSEIFKEIHVNGDPLVAADPIESERMQAAFVKKFGVSEAAFQDAYHSMPVDMAMQRADILVQRYRVDSVPRFIVNGKYVVDLASAGGPERLISLVSDLAAQEHKR